MSTARLAAQCLALLGPVTGPVAVLGPHAARLRAVLAREVPAARDGEVPQGAVAVYLGTSAEPAERQTELRGLGRRLPAGARLVLVDHNQPRALWRRVPAWVRLALAGLGPARARYPAARELAALGFAIERLSLVCGERVQLVLARRR